jgi:tetratricopeptide (TPR) repeat protein
MIRQIRCIALGVLVFAFFLNPAQAETRPSFVERFYEANQAYKSDRFQEAVEGYLLLLKSGYENGHIYYNLGNAYFRLGDLGRAVLAFERARLLIPRDGDLSFNLSHARNQAQDEAADLPTSALVGFLGLDSLNRYEALAAFSLMNVLFFTLLCIRLFSKSEWTYYLSIFLAIVISLAACAAGLKWYAWSTDDRAVVLAKEIVVQAGPDAKDTVLFKLHAGTLVRVQRTENGWTLLQLSKDKRGWAESNQLEQIGSPPSPPD